MKTCNLQISIMTTPTRPQCKHCAGETYAPTLTKGGLLTYRCKDCKKYTTPGGQWGGHNKIHDGLTPQQRWGAKNKKRRNKLRRENRAKKKDLE